MAHSKIDAQKALALANEGQTVRQIAKVLGVSPTQTWRAIRRAVAAGGVLNPKPKMLHFEFAELTVRIWRAKQAVISAPDDCRAYADLQAAMNEFCKAIL